METKNSNKKLEKTQIPSILIGKLLNIGGILEREANRLLLPYNLNQQQFAIFFEIAKAGKVSQKNMVNRLVLERAHVSKVVKKLESMELIAVKSSKEDKRTAWLSLTAKGQETLEQVRKKFGAWNKEWFNEIEEPELFQALDSLTLLQTLFKTKMEEKKQKVV